MILRDFFKKYKIAIIIFALAIAARLILFSINLSAEGGDFIATIRGQDGYYEISKNLIAGNGFSYDQGPVFTPESLRPPVWIFFMAFIAMIFGSYVPVFIFQVIIGSLIPVIGMSLAARVISSRLAVAVGVFLALEPNGVLLSILSISETPFTFLFLLFLVFLFRYFDNQTTRNIVWSGVFLGLSILVKPTVQFFPILVPLALILIYKKSKNASPALYKHCAYFALVSVLLLVPWFFRNQHEFGVIGLSAQPAYNLYEVLVPSVLSIENGTNYKDEFAKNHATLDGVDGGITLTNSDFYIKKALAVFREHKVAFIRSVALSMVTFFTHDGMLTVLAHSKISIPNFLEKPATMLFFSEPQTLIRHIIAYAGSPGIIVLIFRLFWIAVTFLFFVGAWFYLRREKFSPFACIALGVVVYFALVTAANGFGMNARFRIPVSAFIFTFSVYGFSVLWQFVRNRLGKPSSI